MLRVVSLRGILSELWHQELFFFVNFGKVGFDHFLTCRFTTKKT